MIRDADIVRSVMRGRFSKKRVAQEPRAIGSVYPRWQKESNIPCGYRRGAGPPSSIGGEYNDCTLVSRCNVAKVGGSV